MDAQYGGGPGAGSVHASISAIALSTGQAAGGPGRGDVHATVTVTGQPTQAFAGGIGRGDDLGTVLLAQVVAVGFSGGDGRGDVMGTRLMPVDISVSVRVFLEGAMENGFSMRDDLRALGLLPLVEPYGALGYPQTGTGGETVDPQVLGVHPNGNVVDWMRLELRSADPPFALVATRSALLLQNGFIVDTDGISPVVFHGQLPGLYHVAVQHRNHLGVMQLDAQMFDQTTTLVDLTQPYSSVYGQDARKYVFPNMVLWAGDANHDGQLKYTGQGNDRDVILQVIGGNIPTNTITGYKQEDVNLDGVVKYTGQENDRDPVLQNIGGAVPTNVRNAQLP